MDRDELLDRFYDATLDGDDVDHEAFLSEGGADIAGAIHVHQLFQSASETWSEPRRPEQLDRFQIVGDLGAGGLGKVYLGWDPDLRRHVAIKVIARDHWASNEARSIAKLEHQSIVKVFEVGRDHLVMELLDGGTLQDKIQDIGDGYENNMSSLRARLHCLVRIAQGLAYCHDRGILHRDVKPANVLFALEEEFPKLIDFGLAHLDELESLDITQNLVGSPAYLAPEQVESGETGSDLRADIFSFGTMAYELLTLTSPFKRETRQETMDAVSAASPANPRKLNPGISRPIANILAHCMEPDPRKRYASMQEVVLDLQDALADRPISVGSRSPIHRAKLLFKRNRRVTSFASMGVAAATIVALLLWIQFLRSERLILAEEVATLAARIPVSQSGREVNELGHSLLNVRYRANTLDRSVLGRMIIESAPAAAEAVEQWSRHVQRRLELISDFDERQYPAPIWSSVLVLDRIMLPDATWNRALRNRGRITLSDELASNQDSVVYKQDSLTPTGKDSKTRVYKRVPFVEYPDPGLYRFEIHGVWQREVFVDSAWCEPVHITRTPRRLDFSQWMKNDTNGTYFSPLITRAQMSALDPTYNLRPENSLAAAFNVDEAGPEHPTCVTFTRAQEFADWAGGRLPTGAELDWLVDQGLQLRTDTHPGEFVSDLNTTWALERVSVYLYSLRLDHPEQPLFNRFHYTSRNQTILRPLHNAPERYGGVGFRIVYVAPDHEDL